LSKLRTFLMWSAVELFHARAVFEQAGGDSFLNLDRDIAIKRRKEAETIPIVAGAKNDLIEFRENFINGAWDHNS